MPANRDRIPVAPDDRETDDAAQAARDLLDAPHDVAARNRTVLRNTGLVGDLVKKAYRQQGGLDREDLFQWGVLGLMRAAEKYDLARGCEFSTYATPWIRRYLQNGRREGLPSVSPPPDSWMRARAYERALAAQGAYPDVDAAFATIGADRYERERIAAAVRVMRAVVARDDAADGVRGVAVLGNLPAPEPRDDDTPEGRERLAMLAATLARLPDRHRLVLELRFGLWGADRLSLAAIAASLDPPVTKERVRQMEAEGLCKLRAAYVRADMPAAPAVAVPARTDEERRVAAKKVRAGRDAEARVRERERLRKRHAREKGADARIIHDEDEEKRSCA
jgi:RNA polymerase primary sigma factor